MSELATEILGTPEAVTDLEFIGKTFEERREALRQVTAYQAMVKRALLDTVEGLVGQEVYLSFRPSTVRGHDDCCALSFRGLPLDERPINEGVFAVKKFLEATESLEVRSVDVSPSTVWTVDINNILAIDAATSGD